MSGRSSSELKKRSGKGTLKSEAQPSGSTSVSKKGKDKKSKSEDVAEAEEGPKSPVYGPMPTFSGQRLWSRSALIIGLMTIVYFSSGKTKESAFAKFGERIPGKAFQTQCSPAFEESVKGFKGCIPEKCGRILTDSLVLPGAELYGLLDIGQRGFGPAKGASGIYDLTTATLHFNDKRVDLTKRNSSKEIIFRVGDLQYFQAVQSKVRRMVSDHFQLDYWALHLVSPVFYSQLTNEGTRKQEFSIPVVHQDLYKGLHYSALISLSDFGVDFQGGRLVFPDGDNTNRTVEPQKGRVVTFTAGLENRHYTEPVSSGSRLTLHIGFTCDPKRGIKSPKLN